MILQYASKTRLLLDHAQFVQYTKTKEGASHKNRFIKKVKPPYDNSLLLGNHRLIRPEQPVHDMYRSFCVAVSLSSLLCEWLPCRPTRSRLVSSYVMWYLQSPRLTVLIVMDATTGPHIVQYGQVLMNVGKATASLLPPRCWLRCHYSLHMIHCSTWPRITRDPPYNCGRNQGILAPSPLRLAMPFFPRNHKKNKGRIRFCRLPVDTNVCT